MKAVYIEQFGGPEVVKYGDLPDPSAEPGQIVVDAFAAVKEARAGAAALAASTALGERSIPTTSAAPAPASSALP